MGFKLDDIPVFEISETRIGAPYYNTARLALIRLDSPLRIPLEGLRTLDLILENSLWVCVDRGLNDVPIMAWRDFDSQQRGLHEPISCRQFSYHMHARLIHDKIMAAMYQYLHNRIHPALEDGAATKR